MKFACRVQVIGAVTDGGKVRIIKVRCPYCRSVHQHNWTAGDLGYRLCPNGTPAGVYLVVFPLTKGDFAMPDQPAQFTSRIPAGAVIITPEKAEAAFGYVAETGEDFVYLTVYDSRRGPHTVLFAPRLAFDVADMLNQKAAKLTALRATASAPETEESDDDE